jgi:SPFH domain / Band 7 family
MTSEQDESSATWKGPDPTGQNQPPDHASTSATPEQQGLVIPQIDNDTEEGPHGTPSSQMDKLGRLARQLSPVLVPLPFAALIFLFTLPFALRGQTFLPLLPLGVLLIALVVMQGTLLYYAGSNDAYWILCVIIGYAIFLLVGTMAIFGFGISLVLLVVLLLIGIYLARRSIRQIPEGFVDIVLMYGKYARTLYPGLNFKMPWERIGSRLSTKEITWTCPVQIVKITRDQDVKLTATISYQLMPEDAHIAALNVDDWEGSLQKVFVATLQSMINELTPADFVNWSQGTHAGTSSDISTIDAATITRWDHINNILASRVQDKVAAWGIQVNFVRIQDITLIPHLTPSANPAVSMTARPVDAGMTRGANPADVQPLQTQIAARTVENQQGPAQTQPAPAAPRIINVDMLIEAYEAVRTGRLRDPKTIRDIATRFEALANDPNIHFDAARAAQNLNQRASLYEKRSEEKARTSIASEGPTQPNTKERGPTNENLWSGG